MNYVISKIARFHHDADGVTAVEYSVMLALIVLIAFESMQLCGFEIRDWYNSNAGEIDNAING